ncbi:MAG TPA: dipeptide epimerase [Candidatus Limnocylindria bacterium]|nr:dipeptide epimerase [Candidatus Limnocylindria bacterium]
MRITDITYEKVRVKLARPFVVAIGVIETCETLIVRVETDEGITGYGEASPFAPVTGELLDTIPAFIELFKPNLIGLNPIEMEKAHAVMDRCTAGNTSAKAGIDIALHDIWGKWLGQPLYKILGGFRNSFATDVTVGIKAPEAMAEEALGCVGEGYGILKVKAGIDPRDDVRAIRLIREAVGPNIALRVDANQGWDARTAVSTLRAYEEYGVEAVEQPLPWWDLDGLAFVRRHSRIRLMVDESVHSPQDALKVMKKEAADTFNIKLMKSGGIHPALKINAIGEAGGVNCMVGCMLETRLGIAAGAHLVASQKNITEADLDSFREYGDGSGISGGFTVQDGVMTLSEEPGLGVTVSF